MKSPDKDYNFPRKHHWRCQVWSELRRRVTVHPKEAIIIYLAGEQNLDREQAIRNGFHENNLIAVDGDMKVVKSLRGKGQLAVHGDIFQVIRNWSRDVKINGIIFDFCSGITSSEFCAGIQNCLMMRQCKESVSVVNFLRGRDSFLTRVKSSLISINESPDPFYQEIINEKHRGILTLTFIMELFLESLFQIYGDQITHKRYLNICSLYDKKASAVYTSYRSKVTFFDGVIFNNPLYNKATENICDVLSENMHHPSMDKHFDQSLKNQISAILAHRTMRFQK